MHSEVDLTRFDQLTNSKHPLGEVFNAARKGSNAYKVSGDKSAAATMKESVPTLRGQLEAQILAVEPGANDGRKRKCE